MLQSLTNSKHSTISTCSTGALKNLLASRPTVTESSPDDIGGHPSLQARKLKNMARDLDEKLLTETLDDHVEEDDSSDGDSDSVEIRHNGADCAPASRVVSRCESRDSLTSAHSDMITMKHHSDKNQPGFLAQRGASLDRVQGDADQHTPDSHQGRHRRPAPLPLSARNQSSFLRSRQSPHQQQGAAAVASGASVDNDFRRSGNHPTGFGFENRYSDFSKVRPNCQPLPQPHPQPQPTLVNNYVFPAADNSTLVFNDSNVVDDNDDDAEAPKNFASNDAEDDLDDKPTDYSLRFQESEEPEYMSAPPPPPQPQPQQQQKAPANQNADNDDDDDDLCVDAVKSYFIEATPFDTPGRISEATSVNDLTNLPAETNVRRQVVEDEDEVKLLIDFTVLALALYVGPALLVPLAIV